jgi:hypothetical protein
VSGSEAGKIRVSEAYVKKILKVCGLPEDWWNGVAPLFLPVVPSVSHRMLGWTRMRVARRDYDYARASKIAYWRGLTPAERVRLADEARRHALLLHPDWPTDEQRAYDVESHIRLSERFERAVAASKR